jgi:hypothetical protein
MTPSRDRNSLAISFLITTLLRSGALPIPTSQRSRSDRSLDEFRSADASFLGSTAEGGPRLAAPEESPTTRRSERPPHGPNTIDLVFDGSIDRAGIPALCDRLCAVLECSDADLVLCDVGSVVDPNAVTIDAMARLHLTACRLGRRVRFHQACGELLDLLAFFGLSDVLRVEAAFTARPGRAGRTRGTGSRCPGRS